MDSTTKTVDYATETMLSIQKGLNIVMDYAENENNIKENFESEVKVQLKEKTVNFGEKPYTFVYVENVDQTIWFLGNCIAEMLGYVNKPKSITQHVSSSNVKQFGKIEPMELKMYHNVQKMSKFINEVGLFQLITKSKMPNTTEFKNWINNDVLPKFSVFDKSNENILNNQSMENDETMNVDRNKLQIKDFKFGSNIVTFRYINGPDGVWFVAKDVAIMLEYIKHKEAIKYHVSDYNIQTFEGAVFQGPESDHQLVLQNHTKFINEAGFYELIVGSKMPKAQEFKKWVVCEVLPSLRKTGEYSMKQASMADAENMNIINRIIDDADAPWMEEKMKLLEKNNELMGKNYDLMGKNNELMVEIHIKNTQLIQQFGLVQEKDKQLISSLYENGELKTKLLTWKPLVASKPHRPEVFHLLELFSINADDTLYQYGYFCSRIQERSAPNARPKPHEKPTQIFSIKCANSINAYNCLKEHIRETLTKHEYLIIGKRFYCNIPPHYIQLQFSEILSNNH